MFFELRHHFARPQPLAVGKQFFHQPGGGVQQRRRRGAITGAMPGRSTFTATACRHARRAKCTCATEAEATGVASNSANTSASGFL